MARPDYVPRTHSGFNAWQRTIAQFVTDNATAWAIAAAKVTDLNNRSTEFETRYKRIENRNTRTLQEVADFNQYRIEYTVFLRALVQGSLVNNDLITYADKIAMGLNPRTGARPDRPAITSMPSITVTSKGGGLTEFLSKNTEDNKAKRPVNSDGVELHIEIIMGKSTDVETGEIIEITDKVMLSSSKVRVLHQFTQAQRGKVFNVRGRWYNNTDRAKDGQLGDPVSSFVG